MKEAKEIKQLIKRFNNVHAESDYADFMCRNEKLSKQQREEWETDADVLEYELYDIANKINNLNPSKYMMKKYPELDYILSFV